MITSEITKVNYELIRRFKVILNALSTCRTVNPDSFKKYASETADIYIEKYGEWRTMSTTVHKVLRIEASNISHHLFPLGELSEEAQEARNKDYQKDRHSIYTRINQNMDLFSILLISSDPLISFQKVNKNHASEDDEPEFLKLLSTTNEKLESDIANIE